MSDTSNDIASNIELHNQKWKETFQQIADTISGKSSSDNSSSSSSTTVSDSDTSTTNNSSSTDNNKSSGGTTVDDMKMTEKVDISKLKMSIGDYLKDKGELSGAGSILEEIAKSSSLKLNILVLIALSRWQTRDGTTLAVKDKHNPGCITGSQENDKLTDLKNGYETMVKQLESHLTDTDGEWLSSTRLWYVKKVVTKDDAVGLEDDDIKQLGAEEDKKSTSDSTNQQGQKLSVEATGYSPTGASTTGTGLTASGTPCTGYHTLAVDPDVIPLQSSVYIPYFKDQKNNGNFVAEDTGGAIKGNRIDIAFDNDDEANQFGRQTIDIYVGGKGSGGNSKLESQQLTWYNKLRPYVDDVYDKLLGAKPPWQKRTLKSGKESSSKGKASDKGVKVEKKVPHGTHNEGDPDSLLVVLPKNETFAEPVYPDLLTVADNVPQYILTKSTIKAPSNKFFDLGNGMTSDKSYIDSTQNAKTTDETKNGSDKTDSGVKTNGKTTTTKDGVSVTVSTTPNNDSNKTNDIKTSVNIATNKMTAISSEGTKVSIIDESKIPQDAKADKTNSTDKSNDTKQDTNTNSDTGGDSTVDNTVNQETPSTPYIDGQPVSSGTADSALNAINQLTNNQLNEVVGNMQDRMARQIVYDPKKHKNSFKSPAKGKPANNNDAFPIDLKLEELELHYPHAYIHEIQACPQAVSTAKPLLEHAQATEKRIVKLENNMATLLRYYGALGTRIAINCVYWGGTSQYQKYKAIRCMKDNRLEDGQIVQLDQCLTCTRFEPIIGNVYECLNDKGANLCQIMDDNQMSYSNMNEYTKFVHTDEYSEQLKNYTTNASGIKTRNPNDKDFKDLWSTGIKMDWHLVPVEKQKPHIGWRQSINDDGSYLKAHKLASYQYSPENNGSSFGKNNTKPNVWIENKNAMDSNSDSTISQPIASGKSYSGGAIQDTVNGMAAKDWIKSVKQQCSSSGVKMSPIAVGCLAIAMNQDGNIAGVVSQIASIESALSGDNIDNQIITATCYAIPNGTDYFLSTGSKKIDGATSSKDNNKKDDKNKNNSSSSDDSSTHTLNRSNINSWKWVEFAPYLAKMNVSGLDLTPKICYTFNDLNKYAGISKFDTDRWGFPFTEDQIDAGGITYSSGFGYRAFSGRNHEGIDLACDMNTPCYAVESGTVHLTYNVGGVGNILWVFTDDGRGYRFLHLASFNVNTGDHVERGDLIAYTGNGDGNYAPHLHVELCSGENEGGDIDPAGAEGWPLFQEIENGKAGESFGAKEHNLTEY